MTSHLVGAKLFYVQIMHSRCCFY